MTDSHTEGGNGPIHSKARKWLAIIIASTVCFVVGLNATAILSASEDIAEEFHLDEESFSYSFFLVTAWNLAAAIVPMFVLPLMEDLGVRRIYIGTYLLFVVFVIPQAVAPNFATLIVTRVIAGASGGVLQNSVDGIAADLWQEDTRRRAMSLSIYIISLLGGVTFGPVFGGAIIKSLSWRWICYIQLAIYGALLPFIIFLLPEPRAKDKDAASEESGSGAITSRFLTLLRTTVLRSTRMLVTEFIVSSFTLWSSFAFGTVFIMTQSVPLVFTSLYGWSTWQTGVVQMALVVGEIVGFVVCFTYDAAGFPRITKNKANPEARLFVAVPASLMGLTAGFFIYAWTAYPTTSWIAPAIGLGCVGFGIMCVVQAVSTYVTDAYAAHAASAISAVAFGENVFAALLPLATIDMYETLSFQWASSLLGFAALLVSMAPVLLIWKGGKIRSQSKYLKVDK